MRLGGAMGVLTDASALQFRLLNRGKGPAMHSPRAQCDKKAYQFLAKLTVERQENLSLRQEMVESLLVEDGRVVGVQCRGGGPYQARAVVLTTGTFLQALMHTGEVKTPGGRGGDVAGGRNVAKPCYHSGLSCGGSRPAPRRGSTAARSNSPGWSVSRAMPSRSRSRS